MTRFIRADEAAGLVRDGKTIGIGGFGGYAVADVLLAALRARFDNEQKPRDLTALKIAGVGDRKTRGLNRVAVPGLFRRIITSFMMQEPQMRQLVLDNQVAAYMLPLGTLTKLYRAIAAHQPGVVTSVGLHTFVDPRLGGGMINQAARDDAFDVVRLMEIDGKDYLYYPSHPIDICFIRGSYADETGNVTLCREGMTLDQQVLAEAVHNSGGTVIVQVEDIVAAGSLDPRLVQLHHFLVDYVVKAPSGTQMQSYEHDGYWPEITGDIRRPVQSLAPLPLTARKVCCRRAAMELKKDSFVNLGVGMPELIGAVAAEERLSDYLTLSTESGVIGGVPLSGLDMGAAVNPEAITTLPDMLDVYDGGGLDLTVLGLAEIDKGGSVNVSYFNGTFTGPGGFIDISQNTQHVIFMGTFTAGGLVEEIRDGRLYIIQEGKYKKFKKAVQQITFSGPFSARRGQNVQVITERAVFRVTQDGLVLTEIAPGVDLQKDVLAQMEFAPRIASDVKEMDARIFRDAPMGILQNIKE